MVAFLTSLGTMDFGIVKILIDALNAFLLSPIVLAGFLLKVKAIGNLFSLCVGFYAIWRFLKDVAWQNLYIEGYKQKNIKWDPEDTNMSLLTMFGIFVFLTPWASDVVSGIVTFFTK